MVWALLMGMLIFFRHTTQRVYASFAGCKCMCCVLCASQRLLSNAQFRQYIAIVEHVHEPGECARRQRWRQRLLASSLNAKIIAYEQRTNKYKTYVGMLGFANRAKWPASAVSASVLIARAHTQTAAIRQTYRRTRKKDTRNSI